MNRAVDRPVLRCASMLVSAFVPLMRSSRFVRVLGLVLVMASAVVPFAPMPVNAAEPALSTALDARLRELAAMPGLFARYEETKHIALLAEPLVSKGEIYYAPRAGLLRRVIAPHRTEVLLLEREVWLSEGGKHERIDLGVDPTVAAFVGSFRALLRGDRALLEQHFQLSLHEGEGGWELVLKPRTDKMARIVTELRLRGRGLVLEQCTIVEATGDVAEMRFHDVDPTRTWPSEMPLFRPPAAR